jgi:hypothetical protein
MRAIQKVTSDELLTKKATRKKNIIHKNMYILKLLLRIFTTGTQALVILENKI